MLGLIILLQTLALAVSGPATSCEYLPLWVADTEGHFTRQGLRVSLRATRSEVGAAEALAQGQVDLAATSLEALLRFGTRDGQTPRLLLGLTAAPPVALVVDARNAATVRSVHELGSRRIGLSAPGAPEHAWLNALAVRAKRPTPPPVWSAGALALAAALARGEIGAALLPEPSAERLIAERRVALIADLRTPDAAERTFGTPTVSAGVFVRADRNPGERALAAFVRAVVAAEERLASGAAIPQLAERLPPRVVGRPDDFEARVRQARSLYLPDGRVTAAQLGASVGLLRDQLPLPPRAEIHLHAPGRITAPARR